MDPVARALLERYPLPTSAGTANNYRRTENETVDQDQFSVRIDHRFTNRDQVFGRLTRFQEEFLPVTPLPDGSGVTTGTLGPQDTTSWSFASSYQRTFSSTLLNELRIGDTRRAVGRTAARAQHIGVVGAEPARHSCDGEVSQHPADVPHRRLSAARIAGEYRDGLQHQRDRDRRHADLAEGPAHDQGRRGPAVGAPQRAAAAVADRVLHLQQPVQRSPGNAEHGHAARELPARAGAAVLDRPSAGGDPQSRALPGVLRPGRLAAVRSPDGQRRRPLHAELPVHRREQPGGRLQSGDAAARVPRPRRPAARRPAAAQAELRPAARDRRTHHRQDRRARRLRAGLDRDGGHHDAVHDAGLSVPPDRVAADAGQHHPGVHAGERARTCSRSR